MQCIKNEIWLLQWHVLQEMFCMGAPLAELADTSHHVQGNSATCSDYI